MEMMGNGVSAAIPLQPDDRQARAIGGRELARGLMLVRASTIKMLRLHLAMERRDRRVVLETMDDLAALDRKMRDFVEQIPADDKMVERMQAELDEQGQALAREKLTLAAGIVRRGGGEEGGWVEISPDRTAEPEPAPALSAATRAPHDTILALDRPVGTKALLLGAAEPWTEPVELEARSRWPAVIAIAALLVVLAIAAATLVVGGGAIRIMAGPIMELLGG
jgi:hypothetical protein